MVFAPVSLWRDRSGAAAVEFSLVALPFIILVIGILDIALMFFVDGALDSALHMAARDVRTGRSATENWDLSAFKEEVCDGLAWSFDCSSNLLVSTTEMNDLSAVTFQSGVSDGVLSVTETFSSGTPDSYMMIQAFLPWPSWLAPLGVATAHLDDGRYVLSATALFRNEPYED